MRAPALPPARLSALVVPVCLLGLGAVGVAAFRLLAGGESLGTWVSILALFAACMLAERYPVGLDGVDAGGVTLAYSLRRRGGRAVRLGGRGRGRLLARRR